MTRMFSMTMMIPVKSTNDEFDYLLRSLPILQGVLEVCKVCPVEDDDGDADGEEENKGSLLLLTSSIQEH